MRSLLLIIITLSLLSSSFPGESAASLLKEPCISASDCLTANSMCAPFAFICSPFGSFCQCQPGFAEDRGRCKKIGYYNDTCGDQGVCANGANHLVCNTITARCACDIGYQPDFRSQPIKCVVSATRGIVGDYCTVGEVDSCGENLECIDGICTCIAGYMYHDIKDTCVKIGIGDYCLDDQDCFHVIRAVCNQDTKICECPLGYQVEDVTYKKDPFQACLSPNNPPRNIGENCSETGTGQRSYCAPPFVCTQCTPNNNAVSICTTAGPSSLTTPKPLPTTTTKTTTTAIKTTEALTAETTTSQYDYYTDESEITASHRTPSTTTMAEPESKVLLGEFCTRDAECDVLFAICSDGICRCQDGYENRTMAECRESFSKIPLGDNCDTKLDKGFCVKHANCINSTCECDDGYKRGPKNDDCVEMSRTFGFNEPCTATRECYYNLVCLQARCVCSPGYTNSNSYSCRKRQLEDRCPSGLNIECRFISNAACTSDRHCRCAVGFTRESASSCVPLIIYQPEESWNGWKFPCATSGDCVNPAAPKLSICLKPEMKCGCPSNSIYNQASNRCQFALPPNDRGFACNYDSDCPRRSKCIRNTCGGTAAPLISKATAIRPLLLSSLSLLPILFILYC